MFRSSLISPGLVYTGLQGVTRADPDQGGAALCDYYLLRGHAWADSTSNEAALALVEEARCHLPDLAGELRVYLLRGARLHGPGYSVADVGRVQWYRRKVAAWEEVAGSPWPGNRSRGWQDLRLRHLRDQGWSPEEIAGVLGLRTRSIRDRLNSL